MYFCQYLTSNWYFHFSQLSQQPSHDSILAMCTIQGIPESANKTLKWSKISSSDKANTQLQAIKLVVYLNLVEVIKMKHKT